MPAFNDREIFDKLNKQSETLARIDERTARMDSEMAQHHADHEARIRNLERESDKRKGALAVVGASGGVIGGAVMWLLKHIWGGGVS